MTPYNIKVIFNNPLQEPVQTHISISNLIYNFYVKKNSNKTHIISP